MKLATVQETPPASRYQWAVRRLVRVAVASILEMFR
jgi:hypothetical protein